MLYHNSEFHSSWYEVTFSSQHIMLDQSHKMDLYFRLELNFRFHKVIENLPTIWNLLAPPSKASPKAITNCVDSN